MSDSWSAVESDLRRCLLRAGRSDAAADAMLAALAPAFATIERARGKADNDLVWALVAMQADQARWRAREASGTSPRRR